MSTIAAEEYASSLSDLTINSKPLINMLTMLAEENLEHAPAIVQAVEKHLLQVASDIKLPVLYLIDSIVKNVGRAYIELFTQNIVSTFCSCFEKVDERTRANMYKLRQTWNDVFPVKKLYAVDLRVHSIDPAWPITAPPPTSIHVNPRFFAVPSTPTTPAVPVAAVAPPAVPVAPPPLPGDPDLDPLSVGEVQMRDQLLRKQKELIELHQRKLTLELIQTKAKLEEQQKQLDKQTGMVQATQQLLQAPSLLRATKESAQILALQKMIKVAGINVSETRSSMSTVRPQTVATPLKPSESMLPVAAMKTRTRTASPSQPSKAVPHSKDPRLAARNQLNIVESHPADVDANVKLEPSKSKQHITINLGCDNKNNVPNKEPRGLTKPEKVRNASKVCPPSNAVTKIHGATKSKMLSPPSPSLMSMKKIPRLKDASKIITVDLVDAVLSHKKDSGEDKEKISSKKSSPNKLSSPKKKSFPVDKMKSPSTSDKTKIYNKDMTLVAKKRESPRKKSFNKKGSSEEVAKSSSKSPVKVREQFRDGSKYELVDSEGESPSPPPPPMISGESKKQDRARFKEVKISTKGRNYVRRNKSRSRSPVKSDVDLRVNGPPEKLQKLMPVVDLVKKQIDAGTPIDTAKDVDLRQLPGVESSSPGRKRFSTDGEAKDQPPTKKSRAEMFDVLFGNEDVDLRRLATNPATTSPQRQPSPPPPPVISQPMPSSSPTPVSPRQASTSSPTRTEGKRTSAVGKSLVDPVKGNGELIQRDWSKFKGPKSPATPLTFRSRYGQSPVPSKLDRLGRPLLFHRLSADGSMEQKRFSPEDTDMRRRLRDHPRKDMDENYRMIIAQAQEQLQNGQLSKEGYKTVFRSVIEMNELSKLKEAQRRDDWEQRSVRGRVSDLSPRSDDGSLGDSSACSPSSDVGDTRSPPRGGRPDVDDRFHMSRGGSRGIRPPTRGRGTWQWERPPQQQPWGARGPRGMHPQQPPYPVRAAGQDGNYRWRQPRAPFIVRPGYAPGTPAHPSGPALHPSVPAVHPSVPAVHPPGTALHAPGTSVYPSRPPAPISAPSGFEQERRYERYSSPRPDKYELGLPHPPFDQSELPPADPSVLERIAQDTMRTINIDGQPREIRFYGDTGITMVSWDDPREILFQRGQRRVCIDDRDSFVCAFNDVYRDFIVDGEPHKIRFGAPTRELWIDGKWYECYFGGAPINIEIGGKMRTVKLEGPPPQVKLGFTKRQDLCVGKINLIVNAMNMVPVYLDAKPQRFDIENKPHILRFINALTTVLINGRPFNVEFGGLPMPIMVNNKKHFIRFSVLPPGIRPGYVNIRNMEGGRLPSPPPHLQRSRERNGMIAEDSAAPGALLDQPPYDLDAAESVSDNASLDQYEDEEVMPVTGVYINKKKIGSQVPLDMLTNLMPTTMAPSSGFGYQVEPESHSQDGTTKPGESVAAPDAAGDASKPSTGFFPFILPSINVDELFQKLVATGIVPTRADEEPSVKSVAAEPKKEEEPKIVRIVDFTTIETLRNRQPGIVATLYSGIQCSSCGVRFPPEETLKYSQHLDWHFRQNRRERDYTRKAQSRKWYYDVSDWIQFEEIEDLEHRAQSWFDAQQEASVGVEDNEPVIVPSVAVGENSDDAFCVMCHDKFEQFYNEESEEWHLKSAVRVEEKLYHPLCYEDFKDMPLDETMPEVKEELEMAVDSNVQEDSVKVEEEIVVDVDIKVEIICDDDDVKIEEMEVKVENVEEEIIELDTVPPPEVPSEDLTLLEDNEDEGFTEAELVVNAIIDDILECSELQLFGPRVVKQEATDGQADGTDSGISVVEQPKVVGPAADTTHTAVVSSIDGNVQFEDTPQATTTGAGSKIKINITKSIQARESQGESESRVTLEDGETATDLSSLEKRTVAGEDSEPLPPGIEAAPVPDKLKPKLEGRQLTVMPPVSKGVELSGLCSIM